MNEYKVKIQNNITKYYWYEYVHCNYPLEIKDAVTTINLNEETDYSIVDVEPISGSNADWVKTDTRNWWK